MVGSTLKRDVGCGAVALTALGNELLLFGWANDDLAPSRLQGLRGPWLQALSL